MSRARRRSISTKDVAIAAQFKQGKTISGRGIFLIPPSGVDPETGEMSPATCYAHACLVAEVEVDDETGEVAMVRMDSAYELGRALNPAGRAAAGRRRLDGRQPRAVRDDRAVLSRPATMAARLQRISDAGPRRHLPARHRGAGAPAPDGPFGAKGPGEMCANPVLPAVANAIFNAVGVRMDAADHAGKILRAIKAQGRRAAAGAALNMAVRGNIVGIDQPGGARRRCARPIISPTTASRRPPIWRLRSASRCCWKARRASARPRPPRRSPPCSAAADPAAML
jgi:hypothetical protein